jgi:PIN domain nuclease of toxin-antitoxin system
MSDYVLDTSALFAFIEDEEGADEVETLIVNALDDANVIFVSIATCKDPEFEQLNAVEQLKLKYKQS